MTGGTQGPRLTMGRLANALVTSPALYWHNWLQECLGKVWWYLLSKPGHCGAAQIPR